MFEAVESSWAQFKIQCVEVSRKKRAIDNELSAKCDLLTSFPNSPDDKVS